MAASESNMAPVTVCIPVYNASKFIGDTLRHVKAQTHPAMRVLVSVDLSADDSAQLCLEFADDSRFEIVAQKQHLGWIKNINQLIERVETDDYCVLPHDDLIEPDYLVRLQQALDNRPDAAVAFTDIVAFGELEGEVIQKSIEGALYDRVIEFLSGHFDAVAFRGLVRTSRAGSDRTLHDNAFSGYASDTLWMLQILQHGCLIRVLQQPNAAYRKLYRIGSQHHRWLKWDREYRTEAWIEHCVECARLALAMPFDETQRLLILYAVLQRGIKRFKQMGWRPFKSDLSEPHRALIQACIAARVAGIGSSADAVDQIERLRSLLQYKTLTKLAWKSADEDAIGIADPKFAHGARKKKS